MPLDLQVRKDYSWPLGDGNQQAERMAAFDASRRCKLGFHAFEG